MSGGGDVEEDHLVGTLLIVTEREFDGVADIAQFPGFGLAELDTAGYLAVVDVKARNDTSGQHAGVRVPGPGRSRNQMPVMDCNYEQVFERILGTSSEHPCFSIPCRCDLAGFPVNRRKVRADLRPLLPSMEPVPIAASGRNWKPIEMGVS
jgi:hypothetical protein